MKKRKDDYLKYHRVILYYYRAKYNLSASDLDMLLFLYSEQYFGREKFHEFSQILPWDKNRFARLLKNGWIENFRKGIGVSIGRGNKAIYGVSYKTSRMILSLYKKMNGEEIPTDSVNNPLFLRNVSFSDKVYRNMIMKMHEYRRAKDENKPIQDPYPD